MSGALSDHLLYRGGATARSRHAGAGAQWIDTPQGRVRALDSGGNGPALLFAPDGPCVIEHYAALIEELRADFRVVVFDLPGFGLSAPAASYAHRLEQGADVILGVLDVLGIARASLCFSCVNGFYAIAAAAKAPARIERLILSQTPGVGAMQAWTARMIPWPLRVPGLGQLINFLAAANSRAPGIASRCRRPRTARLSMRPPRLRSTTAAASASPASSRAWHPRRSITRCCNCATRR